MAAGEVLNRLERDEEARALAVLHDAAHTKVVVQKGQCLPQLDVVGPGIQVVNQNVVGSGKGTAGVIGESPCHPVKAGQVNAVNDVQSPAEVGLEKDGRNRLHAGNLGQTGGQVT